MRGHVSIPQILDEAVAVVALVGTKGDALRSTEIIQELDGRIDFGGAIGGGDLLSGNEPVTTVHEHMPEIGHARGFAGRLLVNTGIGIGDGSMGVVTAGLTAEIRTIALAFLGIYRLEGLLRSPGFQQRAIHGEMLFGKQLLTAGLFQHRAEEFLHCPVIQQPIAILAEDRGHPDRIVHAEVHKPTEEQVVVQRVDSLSFRSDAIKDLQEQRTQRKLRGNGGRPKAEQIVRTWPSSPVNERSTMTRIARSGWS